MGKRSGEAKSKQPSKRRALDPSQVLQPGTRATGFLDLPLEIRRGIYHSCLSSQKAIKLPPRQPSLRPQRPSWRHVKNGISILSSCKQIHDEAINILYETNTFHLSIDGSDIGYLRPNTKCFTKNQLSRVRHMEFHFQHHTISPHKRLNLAIWAPILSQLESVVIISQQNPEHVNYSKWPLEMQEFRVDVMLREQVEWVVGLRYMVEIFAGYLPEQCSVGFDANGRRQAEAVMDACMGDRWHKVQTYHGDRIFMRGAFRPRSQVGGLSRL